MKKQTFSIGKVPIVLWGENSPQLYLFVHGKGGCKEEAESFAEIACAYGWQVLSLDLPEHGERCAQPEHLVPWQVVPELQTVFKYIQVHWPRVALRATSIGAWFSLLAFPKEHFENALLVSPVLDMEHLIRRMMQWAGVSPAALQSRKEIPTDFGETLSWEYFSYAQRHPIVHWETPTQILYAGQDALIPPDVVNDFCQRFQAALTIMENGEHWFHTPEQLHVLTHWTQTCLQSFSAL